MNKGLPVEKNPPSWSSSNPSTHLLTSTQPPPLTLQRHWLVNTRIQESPSKLRNPGNIFILWLSIFCIYIHSNCDYYISNVSINCDWNNRKVSFIYCRNTIERVSMWTLSRVTSPQREPPTPIPPFLSLHKGARYHQTKNR